MGCIPTHVYRLMVRRHSLRRPATSDRGARKSGAMATGIKYCGGGPRSESVSTLRSRLRLGPPCTHCCAASQVAHGADVELFRSGYLCCWVSCCIHLNRQDRGERSESCIIRPVDAPATATHRCTRIEQDSDTQSQPLALLTPVPRMLFVVRLPFHNLRFVRSGPTC